jgi:hypothetical protein
MSIPKRSTLQKRQTAKLAEFHQKKSRKKTSKSQGKHGELFRFFVRYLVHIELLQVKFLLIDSIKQVHWVFLFEDRINLVGARTAIFFGLWSGKQLALLRPLLRCPDGHKEIELEYHQGHACVDKLKIWCLRPDCSKSAEISSSPHTNRSLNQHGCPSHKVLDSIFVDSF